MEDFKTRVLNSPWTIIIGIAIFGPFALPLLWRNPKYKRGTKVFWTVVTAVLTVFCLWALKYQAQFLSTAMSNAHAAEPCHIEKYRPAYPPGERAVKIFVGAEKKNPVAKFSATKELFEYLKQANGKVCDVQWTEAKDVIENWMHPSQNAEDTVGSEIKTLVAQQTNPQPQTKAAPEKPREQPIAPTAANKTCETTLLQVRDRLSALKAKTYDSQKVRAAEIESILRSIDPGPLK